MNSKSICLLRPPTVNNASSVATDATPPLALAYLAANLEKNNIDTYAIDAVGEAIHQYVDINADQTVLLHGLTTSQILERIDSETFIIGISVMFSTEWPYTKELIREISKKFPQAKIVLGGEHVTATHQMIMQECPEVDYCVLGEGDDTFKDLCLLLIEEKPINELGGLTFRDSQNRILSTGLSKRKTDLSDFNWPSWHLFPIREYIDNAFTHGMNLGRTMPIMASRGCPYQCSFCSSPQMWTTKWNVRTPTDVIKEIKHYVLTYNVTNIDFYDLTAIIQKSWIVEFCNLLLEEGLNITWQLPSGTRSEAIDSEVSKLLYQSGCRAINYAPESGSEEELKRIKKRVDLQKMLTSMRSSYKNGIKIKCNLIFGMPEQDWSDVFKNFIFLTKLAFTGVHDVGCFPFSPYPGSEIFNTLVKEGKIKVNDNYYKNLLSLNNPEKTISYSENISSWSLSKLTLMAMAYFYGLSLLIRPSRLITLLKKLLSGDNTNNKLLMALSNRQRKILAIKKMKEENVNTVVVENPYNPSN